MTSANNNNLSEPYFDFWDAPETSQVQRNAICSENIFTENPTTEIEPVPSDFTVPLDGTVLGDGTRKQPIEDQGIFNPAYQAYLKALYIPYLNSPPRDNVPIGGNRRTQFENNNKNEVRNVISPFGPAHMGEVSLAERNAFADSILNLPSDTEAPQDLSIPPSLLVGPGYSSISCSELAPLFFPANFAENVGTAENDCTVAHQNNWTEQQNRPILEGYNSAFPEVPTVVSSLLHQEGEEDSGQGATETEQRHNCYTDSVTEGKGTIGNASYINNQKPDFLEIPAVDTVRDPEPFACHTLINDPEIQSVHHSAQQDAFVGNNQCKKRKRSAWNKSVLDDNVGIEFSRNVASITAAHHRPPLKVAKRNVRVTNMKENPKKKTNICLECGATLRSAENLWRHQAVHGESQPHGCTDCPVRFSTLKGLEDHKKRMHSGRAGGASSAAPPAPSSPKLRQEEKSRSRLPCTVPGCTALFAKPYNVRRHVRIVHDGIKEFHCDSCDAQFSSRYNMQLHRRRIHGGKR